MICLIQYTPGKSVVVGFLQHRSSERILEFDQSNNALGIVEWAVKKDFYNEIQPDALCLWCQD